MVVIPSNGIWRHDNIHRQHQNWSVVVGHIFYKIATTKLKAQLKTPEICRMMLAECNHLFSSPICLVITKCTQLFHVIQFSRKYLQLKHTRRPKSEIEAETFSIEQPPVVIQTIKNVDFSEAHNARSTIIVRESAIALQKIFLGAAI
ncbi:hypothetical protein NPIL_575211 [Nephila pilipes]|uniref:Uncharacterized protein n=1 Tax=Nephila pilipes TaxID=299642 RepID=A0A8X6QCU7_NEPPI|nr:hypothetical protein NPIL_575211 [Nephila pilipes]